MDDRKKMGYVAIVEARMTSSRLPGKMMMEIGGKPSLQILIERLQRVPGLSDIVVATTINPDDTALSELCERLRVGCFRGSEEDVLGRVLGAAKAFRADVIVEITGDCTFLDPEIVQQSINAYIGSNAEFVANCVDCPHYPGGMDTRVFSVDLLADLDKKTTSSDDREHVSLYFWEHADDYKLLHVRPPAEFAYPDMFIALDEKADLEMMRRIYEELSPKEPSFGLREILRLFDEHPDIAEIGKVVYRKGGHEGKGVEAR